MHAPCAQIPPLGQARSQAPQCAASLFVSAQTSLHSSVFCGHTHCPALQLAASGQARSHEPQCAASVLKFAQSVAQTCSPVGHTQAPLVQAAASGHLVAQSPQCEALLCVSTHSVPQATPLLHVTGAPPASAPESVVPAVPPVPAPDSPNKPCEAPPQWISPRVASRINRQRRPPWAALQAEPSPPRLLDDLRIEVKGGRIRLKPKRKFCRAGSIPQHETRGRCLSNQRMVAGVHRQPSKTRTREFPRGAVS